MKKRLTAWMALYLVGIGVSVAQPEAPTSQSTENMLLRQIQYGESLYRDDIIQDAVQRLYRLKPQHLEGLLAEVRLAARLEDLPLAQARLKELQAVAPGSEAAKQAELLVYLASDEALQKLAEARLYAAAGRREQALALYDQLLDKRFPTAELMQEYWLLQARHSGDATAAIQALTRELARTPGQLGLQKALVELYFLNKQPELALGHLRELSSHSATQAWAADHEFNYLNALTASDSNRSRWQDFLQRHENLPEIHSKATQSLVRQEALLNDPAWRAGQRGLALIAAKQDPVAARRNLAIALQATPDDTQLLGAMGIAYSRSGNRAVGLDYFKRALQAEQADYQKAKWHNLIATTEYWLRLDQAKKALSSGDGESARRLYQAAYTSRPNDIHAVLGLGNAYFLGENWQAAWPYFQKAARIQPSNQNVHRAIVRYVDRLPAQERDAAFESLSAVVQTSPLLTQAKRRYKLEKLRAQIEQARDQQDIDRLIALLRQAQQFNPDDAWASYELARHLRDQGQVEQAFEAYEIHRVRHQTAPATQYAYALLLVSVDRSQEALQALRNVERSAWTEQMTTLAERIEQDSLLEQAQALYAAGDTRQALDLLEDKATAGKVRLQQAEWLQLDGQPEKAVVVYQALLANDQLPAYSYRGMVKAWRAQGGDAQQALDWYAQAMVAADMLAPEAVQPERDNAAFTAAMRLEQEDSWLELGLRKEAEQLYQQQNPKLRIHHDFGWRSDGTEGVSKLRSDTTILQLEQPLWDGVGFVRLDHVRMDTGTLKTNDQGVYAGELGTCGQAGSAGCSTNLQQKTHGTGAAIGWEGEKLSFDVGTTPHGFAVRNWAAGLSYKGKVQGTGWRVTASRRPMANSLLSFAGTTDPATGKKWGGVMASGVSLGLSRDQGGKDGVWADISYHHLAGQSVENNQRMRLMGGYYRRLINRHNELLTAGVNLMHWRYQKDASAYRFGYGGYYSPKQYSSISLPLRYARRTDNWSVDLRFAGSLSTSKSHKGSGSNGSGYTLSAGVERRLSSHWVLGAGIDAQHSNDYSPSRAMLYLRYVFEPWRGSLPLGLEPLLPYANFK